MGFWRIPVHGQWKIRFSTDKILARMLITAEESQGIIDLIEETFQDEEGFRLNIFALEATFPAIFEEKKPDSEPSMEKKNGPKESVSREELHNDLVEGAKTTYIYVSMIILSSIVAAIGVLNNNVAVIIGAMVIAPMLTPNVSLSLATNPGRPGHGQELT